MDIFSKGPWGAPTLLLLVFFINPTAAQMVGEQCFEQFKQGKDDFVLDADESVINGATFISAPKLGHRDCLNACCKEQRCNLAFVNRSEEEGLIDSCYLFDCLYKKKYACRFVRKKGYTNYILESIYDDYLNIEVLPSKINHFFSSSM